tara:strand:- start:264 stop:719 length:456 start_codon:yes stop_codon:yes gene_type:complete
MKIKLSELRKIIQETILKESPFEVPRPLRSLADQMKKVAMSKGFPKVANSIKAFNSGYVGVAYTGPDNVKMMLLDQPGVVGSEDQMGGYVWFGSPSTANGVYNASTSVLGIKSFVGNDGGKYGDVNITKADRQEVYDEFLIDFMSLLDEFR